MDAPVAPGTVRCSDYTRGHRAPITISRLGNWVAWWGRQDASVYVIAGLLFFAAVAVVKYEHSWFTRTFDPVTGVLVMLGLLVAVPFAAGAVASMSGMNIRDWPAWGTAMVAMITRPGSAGVSSDGPVRREPRVRVRSRVGDACWQLPERTP